MTESGIATVGSHPAERVSRGEVRLSEMIAALSTALDITEGQPPGHAARTCVLGMRLAERLGLGEAERSALFYALLLKDLGCSSNAAKMTYLFRADDHRTKRNFKWVNGDNLWERITYIARHVAPDGSLLTRAAQVVRLGAAGPSAARELIHTRCERGAALARLFGLPEATAEAIRALDEHWDGRGHPGGLKRDEIPRLGRILCLAQTVEVFVARDGVDAALAVAQRRRGTWFDPELVDLLLSLRGDAKLWETMRSEDVWAHLSALEPSDRVFVADERMIDRLCFGFAQVVDAKSPWTRRHSEGVAQLAVGIGQELGFPLEKLRDLRRVGLVHDLGKLGVPNMVLDKPGRLTEAEFAAIKRHPRFSREILRNVPVLDALAELAGSHHEKLDGRGYDRGYTAEQLSEMTRVLVTADIFEALSAPRPYREDLPREKVMGIIGDDAGCALCPQAVEGLQCFVEKHGYDPEHPSAREVE